MTNIAIFSHKSFTINDFINKWYFGLIISIIPMTRSKLSRYAI